MPSDSKKRDQQKKKDAAKSRNNKKIPTKAEAEGLNGAATEELTEDGNFFLNLFNPKKTRNKI